MRSESGEPWTTLLKGGDKRSIGQANRAVARVLEEPQTFPSLMNCLWDEDPLVRMRAADAVEKISVPRPDLLRPFKSALLQLAEEAQEPELKWHLALLLPRLPLTHTDQQRVLAALRSYLTDASSLVKTFALQGLSELAVADPNLQSDVTDLLERAFRSGTPAMRARSRKLLRALTQRRSA